MTAVATSFAPSSLEEARTAGVELKAEHVKVQGMDELMRKNDPRQNVSTTDEAGEVFPKLARTIARRKKRRKLVGG